MEQTFIMIKPDGVQRGFVGEIIGRFEKKGFTLKGLKLITVDQSLAQKHYAEHSAKPFFGGLVDYIVSGPVVAMVWQGTNVVTTGRKMIGATEPAQSAPGTIRGDYAIDIDSPTSPIHDCCGCMNWSNVEQETKRERNVIHSSDAVENARKEIALWFPEGITEWQSSRRSWISE